MFLIIVAGYLKPSVPRDFVGDPVEDAVKKKHEFVVEVKPVYSLNGSENESGCSDEKTE